MSDDVERIPIISTRGEKMNAPKSNLQWYLNNSWKLDEPEDSNPEMETSDQLAAEETAGDIETPVEDIIATDAVPVKEETPVEEQ